MNEKNWKEKVFVLLKKFRISNSVLWQIYKPFSRILNFIKHHWAGGSLRVIILRNDKCLIILTVSRAIDVTSRTIPCFCTRDAGLRTTIDEDDPRLATQADPQDPSRGCAKPSHSVGEPPD